MKLEKDNNISNSKKYNISFIVLILIILTIVILFSFKIYASDTKNYGLENKAVANNEEENDNKEQEVEEELNTEDEQKNTDEAEEAEEIEPEEEEIKYVTASGDEYSIIGKVSIPSLNIEQNILSKNSPELLKIAATRYWGPNPHQVGNMVIAGHNYKDSRFFGNLTKIKAGDTIKITDSKGKTLDYSVYDTQIVDPTDTSCTTQLTDGHTEVTLFTCYYQNGEAHASKRFVVRARVY